MQQKLNTEPFSLARTVVGKLISQHTGKPVDTVCRLLGQSKGNILDVKLIRKYEPEPHKDILLR